MGNDFDKKRQTTDMLLSAVKEGDIRLVRKSLMQGAALNGYDEITPLGVALETKNIQMARFLIKQGADVTRPHKGVKPLVLAIYSKDADMVEHLALNGANTNETLGIRPKWNEKEIVIKTPLIIAIEEGAFEVAQTLVKHGADPLKFVWQNENAFVTLRDYNRDDKWLHLLKSNIKRSITHQNVEMMVKNMGLLKEPERQ